MAANATIDITSITAPTKEVNTNKQNVSSPCSFEHVFKDANDKYSKKDNSIDNQVESDSSVPDTAQNTNTATKITDDTGTKQVEQKSDVTETKNSVTDDTKVSENNSTADTIADDIQKPEIANKPVESNNQEANNQEAEDLIKNCLPSPNPADGNAISPDKGSSEITLQGNTEEILPQNPQQTQKTTTNTTTNATSTTTSNATSNATTNASANTTADNNNAQNTLNAIVSQINDGNIQILTPSALPSFLINSIDTKLNNDDVKSQAPVKTPIQNVVQIQEQPQMQLNDLQKANNAPLVKVNTEALVSDVNVNNMADTKQNTQDIVNKTSITQEVLDATDAKVVSVETPGSSNSNLGNLLNNQSAQEQTVKLAISNNSTPVQNAQDTKPAATLPEAQPQAQSTVQNQTANVVKEPTQNVHANSESANFSEILNQANATNQLDSTQNQAPKEISKTDIASQVHSQLNNLKPEEGTTKITIVLKPDNLGKINIELMNGKGGLTAQMTTDSPQVKEILDKHLDSLKSTLGDNGVNVNHVNVKVHEVQKQDNSFSFEDNGQRQQQPQNNKQQQSGVSSANVGAETTDEKLSDIPQGAEEVEQALISEDTGKIDYRV